MNTDSKAWKRQYSNTTNTITNSKNFPDITGYQRMSNNKFVELCDQAYLFKTVTLTHIHTAGQNPHQSCKQNNSVTKTRYPNKTAHVLDESAWQGNKWTGHKQYIRELWVLGKDDIKMDLNN